MTTKPLTASEAAALRVFVLLETDAGSGERKTFSSATQWKIPAVWRKAAQNNQPRPTA